MLKNIKNIVTIAVFCLLIGVITVASLLTPVKEYSVKEKRNLAQMPEFSLSALFDGSFTKDYESYITDQFVARDTWVSVKNKSEMALGKKDADGVYFGSDDYLIGKHEYRRSSLKRTSAMWKNS